MGAVMVIVAGGGRRGQDVVGRVGHLDGNMQYIALSRILSLYAFF